MTDIIIDFKNLKNAADKLGKFPAYMQASLDPAMHDITWLLARGVAANMHWRNPRPRLEPSLFTDSEQLSAKSAVVGSAEPHARRRNYGFSGKTDRLGRFFRNDPGQFFMEKGIEETSGKIERRAAKATEQALSRLAQSISGLR